MNGHQIAELIIKNQSGPLWMWAAWCIDNHREHDLSCWCARAELAIRDQRCHDLDWPDYWDTRELRGVDDPPSDALCILLPPPEATETVQGFGNFGFAGGMPALFFEHRREWREPDHGWCLTQPQHISEMVMQCLAGEPSSHDIPATLERLAPPMWDVHFERFDLVRRLPNDEAGVLF